MTACRRQPELLAVGRARRRRRQQPVLAPVPGRLLLQDLHVAAEPVDDLRALHPPHGRPRHARRWQPDPDRYDKLHAHCDVLVVGGGPAGLAAALAAGRSRRARASWSTSKPSSAARCCRRAAIRSTASRRPTGSPTRWPSCAPCRRCALLPRTTAFGYYDHNYRRAWSSGSAIICRRARRSSRASACGSVRAKRRSCWRPARSSGRWSSPTTTGRASCWRRPRAPIVNRYAVRAGQARASSSPTTTAPMRRRSTSPMPASPSPPWSICAVADGRAADRGAPQASRSSPATPSPRAKAAGGSAAPTVRRLAADGDGVAGAPREIDCDCSCVPAAGTRPCICSRSRAASCASTTPSPPSCRTSRCRQQRSAGAARGSFALGDCLEQGFEAGRPPPPTPASARPIRARGRAPAPAGAVDAAAPGVAGALDKPRDAAKAFVDFQNDVTAADVLLAHREGYRSVEHLKRYTTMGMGTDQGKTSNVNALALLAQTRGTACRGGRHHHLPPALYAGDDRRLRRPRVRRPPRSDPPHAAASLARAARRRVRECRPVAARLVLSAAGREHARRGQARGEGGAHRRRHPRRLDPRQDRHPGAGRRRVPQLGLHQRLEQARARPLPLRPDVRRGRHGVRRRRHHPARRRTIS